MTTPVLGAVVDRTAFHALALQDTIAEFARQDERWGIQRHPSGTGSSVWRANEALAKRDNDAHVRAGKLTWLDILNEEVCEAFAVPSSDTDRLREELIQVAAVALQWAVHLDIQEVGEQSVRLDLMEAR